MINLLIVEDDEKDSNSCEMFIKRINHEVNIYKCLTGVEACQIMESKGIDGVLIDIEMPEMNGFELAFRIRKTNKLRFFPIVFVTATDNDTIEAYREFHHNGYVKKPYSFNEFRNVIEPFLDGIIAQKNNPDLPFITIKTAGNINKIFLDEILYIETISRKTNIVTFSNNYKDPIRNLKQLITEVNDSGFIQCHRKCYVNLNKIHSIHSINYKSSDIYFTYDGSIKCPLGYKYKKYVTQKFMENQNG